VPDVAAAENDVRNAQIAVDDARERLAATLVVAPLAGVIGPVRVSEGGNYGAGGEITTLLSATDLYVAADIDEVDRPLITIGQAVTITVTAFPGTPLAGQIAALSATSQTRGGSTVYQAQLTFDSPTPSLALLPGMTTDVRIITTARSNVLLLPGSAIRRAGERQYVVVRRQGRDEEVAIRTGVRSGGDVEIVAGLAEGDLVVPR
jgi:RND family efflux transporter MFP subunit